MVNARVRKVAAALAGVGGIVLLAAAFAPGAAAGAGGVLRIGTGPEASPAFALGRALAEALHGALAGTACEGEACAAPPALTVAQLSSGSIANARDLEAGRLEAAFVQAEVARLARAGAGPFAREGPLARLRAVAALYPESLHVVVLRRGPVRTMADLRGRRVSLDRWGSGTLPLARRALAAYGLGVRDLRPQYLAPARGLERLAAGKLDAVFVAGGVPLDSVTRLSEIAEIRLVPVQAARLGLDEGAADAPTLASAVIAAGAYPGTGETPTLASRMLLAVRADLPAEWVYRLTEWLWAGPTLERLAAAHPLGATVSRAAAPGAPDLPLHPGAARYYRDAGLSE